MPKVAGIKRVKKFTGKKKGMLVSYESMVGTLEAPDLEPMSRRADWDFKIAGLLTSRGIAGQDRIKYLNFARSIIKRYEEGTLTDQFINAKKSYYMELYAGTVDESILDEIVKIIRGGETA